MLVEVLLFAGPRERARRDRVTVQVEDDATVSDLLDAIAHQHPELGAIDHCRVALDHELVEATTPIAGSHELALIPPVSGGHDGRIRLCRETVEPDAVVDAVAHADAGAAVTFVGNVRRHSRGKTIERLEYEAYDEMALRTMTAIATAIETKIPGTRVAIFHRLGTLTIGETAVVVAASAPHRAQAFEACREAIERLKDEVPIWKKEVATDGSQWIGQGP